MLNGLFIRAHLATLHLFIKLKGKELDLKSYKL